VSKINEFYFSILNAGDKKLYVPRVEDKNSHMRMLNILRIDDLVANSMNILEPTPVDADGNARQDGTSLSFIFRFLLFIYCPILLSYLTCQRRCQLSKTVCLTLKFKIEYSSKCHHHQLILVSFEAKLF